MTTKDVMVNLDKYLGENQIDFKKLYPKDFDILTYNPYWSMHPILERYKEYEQEQMKKEKIMNTNLKNYVKETLEKTATKMYIKAFFDETTDKNDTLRGYFIDTNNPSKTLIVDIHTDKLAYGWATRIEDDLRKHFGKDLYSKYHRMLRDLAYVNDTASKSHSLPKIKDVRFNGPATIIFWSDDTKTVVKAHDEAVDYEKGLAMAIAKKALGNKGNYFNEFKKWLPEEEKTAEITIELEGGILEDISKGLKEAFCPQNMEFKFKVKETD